MLREIGAVLVIGMVAATYGCAQQSGAAAVVEDKAYALTPTTVSVKAGIVRGAMTDMKVRADRDRFRPHRDAREAHRLAEAEEHLRQRQRPPGWGQDRLPRRPGTAHEARGLTDRADPQARRLRRRAPGPGPGSGPERGRGVPGGGVEGEVVEGDPPRADVHPVAVQGRGRDLRRDHRGVEIACRSQRSRVRDIPNGAGASRTTPARPWRNPTSAFPASPPRWPRERSGW